MLEGFLLSNSEYTGQTTIPSYRERDIFCENKKRT